MAVTLALYLSQCAGCHGNDARGTAKGPGLVDNAHIEGQSNGQLRDFPEEGREWPVVLVRSVAATSCAISSCTAKISSTCRS